MGRRRPGSPPKRTTVAGQRRDRILEGDRVCQAIETLDHAGDLRRWAALFTTLGDPSRLALLLAIAAAGPISVSDLAVATGLQESTTSHALALLRAGGTVVAERDGRVVRYRLADAQIRDLLGYAGLEQLSLTASAARQRDLPATGLAGTGTCRPPGHGSSATALATSACGWRSPRTAGRRPWRPR